MAVGDWVQSIIGSLALAATAVVAWMVYRLQKKDAKRAEQEKRKEFKITREREMEVEAEKERRTLRRERHREDYQAAINALNVLDKVCTKIIVYSHCYSRDELIETGYPEAIDQLRDICKRIPAFTVGIASISAASVAGPYFPSKITLKHALSSSESDADRLYGFIHEACKGAIYQRFAAEKLQIAIHDMREDISAEWGA
ncbi:hypothetical protein [Streptosporangium sp. NPDC002607]